MFEIAQIEVPVETLARGASQNAMTHQRCFTRHAAVAAADLEGFAHSAAAEGARSTQACAHVHELSAK